MLNPFIKKCIDINTEYCPCLLAETNHCTFCSKLQGKESCDCNWSGVCIFYEKYWQDKYKQNVRRAERLTEEVEALRQEQIGIKTYLLEFTVSEALAQKLDCAGAFVFLRRFSDPQCSHFPIGVMKVEGNRLTVVIEAVGAKSGRFLLNKEEQIVVRGPYYNGVLGKPWVDDLKDGSVILVAGGIGQAPALPILKTLRENGNKVRVIASPGKVGTVFLKEAIKDPAVIFYSVSSLRKEGFTILRELMWEKQDLLVSAGPDAQHSAIIEVMNSLGVNLPMAATNNAIMCCGEGLCGSCCQLTQDNKTVKMCKTQLNYQDIMQE